MARKKVVKAEVEDVDELRELVDGTPETDDTESRSTRRNLLKMAGAALAGAAGAAALRAVPAAAATGDAVLQGCYNFATTDQPTYLIGGATTANSETGTAFIARGSTGLRGAGYFAADHTQEVGVFGISKGDNVNSTVGGAGTGIVGLSNTGRGSVGVSNTGPAVMGVSGSGYDAQLGFPVGGGIVGTGRLAMVGRFDANAAAPNIPPGFVVTSTGTYSFAHELIRGSQATIWASRYAASGTNQSRWKRINTVRTDTADGLGGVFKPFRLIDTRGGTIKAASSVTVVPVAGHGTGSSSIPGDAIAVMGNLTAVAYTGPGFLTIMPAGIVIGTGVGQYNPNADPSSVNFIVGQGAIANSFVCGLSGGSLQVYVGDKSSHFIIDITAYLQ